MRLEITFQDKHHHQTNCLIINFHRLHRMSLNIRCCLSQLDHDNLINKIWSTNIYYHNLISNHFHLIIASDDLQTLQQQLINTAWSSQYMTLWVFKYHHLIFKNHHLISSNGKFICHHLNQQALNNNIDK